MAQITVVYKDFEEMKEIAKRVLGIEEGAEPMGDPEDVATAMAEPMINTVSVNVVKAPVPGQTAVQTMPETAAQATPTAVPTSTHEYTLDDLARAGMTLMDAGRQADVQGLLNRFGVDVLPALPKDQYGAFATALREMGAQI